MRVGTLTSVVTAVALSGCATQQGAPVEDRMVMYHLEICASTTHDFQGNYEMSTFVNGNLVVGLKIPSGARYLRRSTHLDLECLEYEFRARDEQLYQNTVTGRESI